MPAHADVIELSAVQKSILSRMRRGHKYTAFQLSASLATLRVLERAKLIKSNEEGVGADVAPRTGTTWERV